MNVNMPTWVQHSETLIYDNFRNNKFRTIFAHYKMYRVRHDKMYCVNRSVSFLGSGSKHQV